MRHKGQSLMEVLIGIGLVAFFAVAAAGIIAPSLRTNGQAAQVQMKAQLGNELLQSVNAWAAGNWNSVLSLATGTGNHYYLNDLVSPFVIATGSQTEALKYTFTRYFYLDDVYRDGGGNVTSTASGNSYDPSTKRVTVVVQNVSSTGAIVPVTYVGYLTRTTGDVFNQTNWSGSSNQTSSATLVTGDFATSSNVAGTGSLSSTGIVTMYTSSGTMTTYAGPGGYGSRDLAFDGTNIWVTGGASNTVMKISPTGIATTYAGIGVNTIGIAYDGTGNMWVTGYDDNTVTKINVSTGATTTYIGIGDVGGGPVAIAFDGAGNVWTANFGGSVTKINVSTGATTTYSGLGAAVNAIAYDGAGNMWVVRYHDTDTVTKVNVSTGATTTYSGGPAWPYDGIIFDGTNMWVPSANDGTVTKFSLSGDKTVYAGGAADIAFDGTNIWMVSGDAVTKMSLSGDRTVYTYPGLGGSVIALAGTNIWTTNYTGIVSKVSLTGTVPAGAMTTYTGTGSDPLAIAFDGINMWTVNYDGQSATKISPAGAMTTYSGLGYYLKGIAYDGAGNMWVVKDLDINNVLKVSSSGVVTTYNGDSWSLWDYVTSPYSGGPFWPAGSIVFDGTNMWVPSQAGVTKVSPAGGMTTYVNISGSIVFDGTNVLILGQNIVTRINPSTGAMTTSTFFGFGGNWDAFDGTNVWTADYLGGVTKISTAGIATTYTGTGVGAYKGIAYDGAGNMWVTGGNSSTVTKISTSPSAAGIISLAPSGTGGYVASGTLDSVTFDTGVASGTQLNSFVWQGSANSSTAAKFQFAVSNSATGTWSYMGPSGGPGDYFTGNPGVPVSLVSASGAYTPFAGYRYFRYRITLFSDGARLYTPTVTGVAVNWSP